MRSERLVAALLAGLTCGCSLAPVPVAAARPTAGRLPGIEPNGWQPIFAADFTTGAVPRQCTAFDGAPGGQAASYYRPDEVQVSGGMLRLSIRRRDFGEWPYTAGGLGCFQVAQLYGRYEYRARVAPGVGIDSCVTLSPEVDPGESGVGGGPGAQGAQCAPGPQGGSGVPGVSGVLGPAGAPGAAGSQGPPGGHGDVTAIGFAAEQGVPESARLSNADGDGVTRKAATGRYADGFHDYLIEWSPVGVRLTVDDQVRLVDNRASTRRRWIGFSVSTGGEDSGLPGQGAVPAEFLVDWIRVYTYEPGAEHVRPSAAATGARSGATSRASGRGDAGTARGTASAYRRLAVVGCVLLLLGTVVAFAVRRRPRGGRPAHRA